MTSVGRALTILGVVVLASLQAPQAFGYNSNRVSRYPDGCVRHKADKQSAKAQRRREKIAEVNVQARELAQAFRGR